jgi:phosphoserine phosphatase
MPQNGAFSGPDAARRPSSGGKITRVEAWLESLGLWWGSFADSVFYSDSHNDLPLMQQGEDAGGRRSGRQTAAPCTVAKWAGKSSVCGRIPSFPQHPWCSSNGNS